MIWRLVSDCCLAPIQKKFQLYHGENKLIFNEMMMRSAELDLYSASSLKQQSMGSHVAPPGHIILIPSQPVFALSS